jgi:hypothetical protein
VTITSDHPPHLSAQPMPPPGSPDDPQPNAAMLKGDINTGRTGDKNEVFDPGLAALGTDDEAGGSPVTPARVKLARANETERRWRLFSGPTGAAHDDEDGAALYAFVGGIAAIGLAIVAGLMLLS